MFGFLKKKKKKSRVQFIDLNGNSLQVGDKVLSKRYELGDCMIVEGEKWLGI